MVRTAGSDGDVPGVDGGVQGTGADPERCWEPAGGTGRQALEPLGIAVMQYDSETGEPMPFAAESFDLVARHESYDAGEVARVLRPGGRLLTLQVHGLDVGELHAWFGGQPAYPDATLQHSRGIRERRVCPGSG